MRKCDKLVEQALQEGEVVDGIRKETSLRKRKITCWTVTMRRHAELWGENFGGGRPRLMFALIRAGPCTHGQSGPISMHELLYPAGRFLSNILTDVANNRMAENSLSFVEMMCIVKRLHRWMSSVDAKPGLNMMMLDMLQRRYEEAPEKYRHVCLMLDAMAIKNTPHTQSMCGYVKTWGTV